jgi:hypothetical protein
VFPTALRTLHSMQSKVWASFDNPACQPDKKVMIMISGGCNSTQLFPMADTDRVVHSHRAVIDVLQTLARLRCPPSYDDWSMRSSMSAIDDILSMSSHRSDMGQTSTDACHHIFAQHSSARQRPCLAMTDIYVRTDARSRDVDGVLQCTCVCERVSA